MLKQSISMGVPINLFRIKVSGAKTKLMLISQQLFLEIGVEKFSHDYNHRTDILKFLFVHYKKYKVLFQLVDI